ncbi:hypothetical protein N7468_004865 [Penicillium chermesinum]|uniref:FAD dependent oxidoreductase domain-containing protein n=1 Tax=Penicillium chermesinum TaxID=63820 RepID=A0A9W9TSZ5_9EURO|nr:uncharacterized protein N7468_004865 [Penicillium chermesinum]KAJ5240246.1 hypothetical protein N7468_004865 [Penicillium chermesinum]
MAQFDVAVVGLGVLGSGAAYYAAKKGAKVIGFEQFELGHVRGASHDTSRIVRTSNFAPEYVKLAKSAYEDWAELARSLDSQNVPYELLDSQEVKRRWPQFDIPDNVQTVFTADSGIAHAAKTVGTLQSLARSHGAILKENTPVDRVTPQAGGGVVIQTPKSRFTAGKVILATDAWINKLLAPLSVHIPVSVMQEQVTYYKPTDASAYEADKLPVWIWQGEHCFYGFPCYGEPTIKAGRDFSNNFMTPEQRTFVHSPQLLEQLTGFMKGFMPDEHRQPLRTITCQYTITPDRQFIISPLENYPDIIVGLGAAHAFKFAPAFGRALAELAVDGQTKEDVSKFGIPRAATNASKL